mgnify:FL=1
MRSHYYRSSPPEDDEEVRCDVCGATIRADITHTSDQTLFAYTVTGTTYHHADLSQIDRQVDPVSRSRVNCWLCGSNRWHSGGKRGDL